MKRAHVILVYHGVQPGHPYCVEPELFAAQMAHAAAHFAFSPLSGFLRTPGAAPALSVTFDDGYRNFTEYALPVLKKYGIPSTIYIPTAYVGKSNDWDRGLSGALLPLMGIGELREIRKEGVSIGSHTQTHPRLRGMAPAELEKEIRDSKKILEDMLGEPVRSFSYPYGGRIDFDERAVAMVEQAGYGDAVTTCFGRFNGPAERFTLPRITILPRASMAKFTLELNGFYDWMAVKERISYSLKKNFRFGMRDGRERSGAPQRGPSGIREG